MRDSKDMLARVNAALKEAEPGFVAYTERDGGPWYIIAGFRDSWHGAQRVADTELCNRDEARAFLLHMMGHDTPGYTFTIARKPESLVTLYWEFACNGVQIATVWCDEACRAFPKWTASIGMRPRRTA